MYSLTITIGKTASHKIMEDMIVPAVIQFPTMVEEALEAVGLCFPTNLNVNRSLNIWLALSSPTGKMTPLSMVSLP